MNIWWCHLFNRNGLYLGTVHIGAKELPTYVERPSGTYRYRPNSRTGVDLWFDEEPVAYVGARPS
jgi:hypothetical protein